MSCTEIHSSRIYAPAGSRNAGLYFVTLYSFIESGGRAFQIWMALVDCACTDDTTGVIRCGATERGEGSPEGLGNHQSLLGRRSRRRHLIIVTVFIVCQPHRAVFSPAHIPFLESGPHSCVGRLEGSLVCLGLMIPELMHSPQLVPEPSSLTLDQLEARLQAQACGVGKGEISLRREACHPRM